MHARGEGDIARPGVSRSIHFRDCELHGVNLETEASAAIAFVNERLPDQLPWPAVPWKIGEIEISNAGETSSITLHIPTVAFQHLWDLDLAELPQKKRFGVLSISGQVRRNFVWVYDVGFEVGPSTHPIVPQLVERLIERLGQAIDQWIRRTVIGLLWGFVSVILVLAVLELIRWFWR
jgi:hypothetical protein